MSEPLGEQARRRLLELAAADEDPRDDTANTTALPTLPPRYEVVRELGRGGMGVVYEVQDHQLGRRVALKTLAASTDPELRVRLQREALAVARLRHPHIAAVFDATPEFLTMQLVDGGPIAVLAPTADAKARRTVVLQVRDAARALQHAHEQGLVHRDLKPSNLLVERGHVFVVDFGLAKAIDARQSMSLAGSVVGTPAFVPPEQALGQSERVDARSDVYGLGATLFCCLTGAPPFVAADLPTLLRQVVEQPPPVLPGDRDLAVVVATCLAKDPERRYPSAGALADDLERWLQQLPVRARPPSWSYRLRKGLQRHRSLWRAAAIAAVFAIGGTALVTVPIALRESAARTAASEAVALADHSNAVLQDAAMFLRLGDHQKAWQLLDGAIATVREFLARHEVPRARYLLSRLLRARGRGDEALHELGLTLAAAPELIDARFERGLLLAAVAEPTPAQRALAIDDLTAPVGAGSVVGDIDRLFGRAERLRLEGAVEPAMALLREVLEYEPIHVPARRSLARLALARGDHDLARYYAASAVDLQQGYGPVYLARERQVLPTSMWGLEGALIDFAGELHDGPDNALALAHRGLVQLRRALRRADEGHAADAITAAQAAVDDHTATLHVHDRLAGARNNRAVCWLVLERLQASAGDGAAATAARLAADADLAIARQLLPGSPEVHFNRGLAAMRRATILRALGRQPQAHEAAQEAEQAFALAAAMAPAAWPHLAACNDQQAAAAALRGS